MRTDLTRMTVFPDGFTCREPLPGHRVVGLLYYADPFQRMELHSLRTTGLIVAKIGGGK